MDKTVAGLIGAVAALSAAAPSRAAVPAPPSVQEALRADSYADLLRPIPNAAALLAPALAGEAPVEKAQLVVIGPHHHHHRYYRHRRYYRHHHHHHHHHSQD